MTTLRSRHFSPKPRLMCFLFRLLGLCIAGSLCCAEAGAAERPNVLLVLLDDLGFSDLGCYGGEIPTPHIDQLGHTGLRFTAMSNSARCCPSRASLLTGLHPGQAGIPNFGGQLNERCVTLAEVLGGAGYRTYAVGKWHVGAGPKGAPTARGFDEFFGYTAGHSQDQWDATKYARLPEGRKPEIAVDTNKFYATDVFSDYAIEFIRQAQAEEKPWLLYLAHSSPHFPIQAPAATVEPLVKTYSRGWDVLREERFARMKQLGLVDHDGWKLTERSLVPVEENDAIANGYSGRPNPAWDSLPENRREDLAYRMAVYAAMVRHVDEGMGRIIAQLREAGTYDDTLILVLSDNGACYEWGPFGFDGESRRGTTTLHEGPALQTIGGPHTHSAYGSAWANLSNTPFRLYKHFTHQGGISTPFIVHWPSGVEGAGRFVRDPTHVMDVMPTLVELCGAEYPKMRREKAVQPMEGTSLAPLLKSGTSLPPRAFCYQHEGARAIHKSPWKLVWGKRFPAAAAWELYDVTKDPCETNNLAKQHSELVAALSQEWEEWARRTGALAPTARPGPRK